MGVFKSFQSNGIVQCYRDYTTKNVIAGDTDSSIMDLSVLFPRGSDVDEVVEFADNIGDTVNKMFPNFMSDVFNVHQSRRDIIMTEREVVSDKSIFLAKKMYVMNLVNKDGKKVDTIKMMGVAIIKSDTPVVVQDMLIGLVDLMLDDSPYEVIREYILEFKETYENLGIYYIGKPTAVKSLTKYVTKYEKEGTLKGFPYHVRAAMNYNQLCADNSHPDIITSADKVRVVYIKHPKFKYVAIPVSDKAIPDFISSLVIDKTVMWGTVVKKFNAFLVPLGMDLKSRQIAHTKTLFNY